MKNRISQFLTLGIATIAFTACGQVKAGKLSNGSTYVKPSQLDSVPTESPAPSVKTAEQNRKISPESSTDLAPFIPQTPDDVRNAARSGSLYCPFPDECNLAVALISVVTDQGLERCTGFLTSQNEVMTNDHCVDHATILRGWESRLSNLPCNGFIYVHFAPIPGDLAPVPANYTYSCKSVEYRSGESGISSPDYSVIQLQSDVKDRAPLVRAKTGFNNKDKAKVFRVQMTSDGTQTGFNGIQSRLDCEASLSTYLYPSLSSSISSLMTFGDCGIQRGNSGSPVFNSKGEVGAIIQGYLLAKEDSRVAQELNDFALDGTYGEVAIGSQLACQSAVNVDGIACATPAAFGPTYPGDYLDSFGYFDQEILPKLGADLEWRSFASSVSHEMNFLTAPHCAAGSSFESHLLKYKKGLNRFMQPEWRAQNALGDRKATLTSNAVSVSIGDLGQGFNFTEASIGSVLVPACTLSQ